MPRHPAAPCLLSTLAALLCAGPAACDEAIEPRGFVILDEAEADAAPPPPPPGAPCTLPDNTIGVASQANMSLACWHEVKAEPVDGLTPGCFEEEGAPEFIAHLYCHGKCEVTTDSPLLDDPEYPNECVAGKGVGVPSYLGGCEDAVAPGTPTKQSMTVRVKKFIGNPGKNHQDCLKYLAAHPDVCAEEADHAAGCTEKFVGDPVQIEYTPATGVCCLPQ